MPGYGCEDHFQELDTIQHSWECLAELLAGDATHGILCDVGVPVIHRGVRYNCRAYLLDGRVLLLRPKLSLADDGNYRCGPWHRLQDACLAAQLAACSNSATSPAVLYQVSGKTCPGLC